ncbi:MAG TPA: NAD(P)H-dependent oxidoreductase [Aquabacterium sp.]|nr:NAD(P)H-dependent oxidoreductase [Aquabacterium sp.]
MSSVSAPRPVRLLAVSGSARTGSFNRQLLALAVRKAQAQGAETTIVDLRALGLPLYDADWHAANGFPAAALAWRELMASHDGLLLATPEYNAFPTPLLINSFDWLSLVPADAGLPSGTGATGGMPVGLMAASPGAFGGIRALPLVRTYLSTNFAMVVVPEQVAVPHADQQFNEDGGLLKVELDQALLRVVAAVIRQARWRRAG